MDLRKLSEEAEQSELHGLSREVTLRRLLESPGDFFLLMDLAIHELTFRRYAEAEAALDKAEATCPKSSRKFLLAQRGHLAEKQGKHEAAMRYYMEAHKLAPDEASSLIYAGSVAFESGDAKRAIDLATRATQCTKGCLEEAWFNLGGYLLAQQRYAEAREAYVQALSIDPNDSGAQTRLEDITRILALQKRS